jgi:hypothetical protein
MYGLSVLPADFSFYESKSVTQRKQERSRKQSWTARSKTPVAATIYRPNVANAVSMMAASRKIKTK